jgi:hypothetical protein
MQIAVDAIRAAACPHYFMGVTHQGLAGITSSLRPHTLELKASYTSSLRPHTLVA